MAGFNVADSESTSFPKRYNPREIESKWQTKWLTPEVYKAAYRFDKEDASRPVFSIDTPPPFTSGELHMGHAYWTVINDTLARYKRMRGYNVLLPQGWDCQGLPTELKVQSRWKVRRDDRNLFRAKCVEFTYKMLASMKETMIHMGYRPDWEQFEYRTMDTEYRRKVQNTLLTFNEKGLIYRDQFPVHWCPSCETALAQAEVGYVDVSGTLYYIRFTHDKGYLEIATTRPELVGACQALAVNPDDERYTQMIGGKVMVPLYGSPVPVLADAEVDKEFGTGAVMICTFGDEQDIRWQKRYKLEVKRLVDEKGRLVNSGKYDGLTVGKARKAVVTDLEAAGLLSRRESITHKVLSHTERSDCMSPVEFLIKTQFFIKTTPYKQLVIDECRNMKWFPEYMLQRLEDWVNSIEWDWLISRQRIYGTPIPFWYCNECGMIIPPKREDLPVTPENMASPVEVCPKCGSGRIEPSLDVCDVWVDSSISPLIISGFFEDSDRFIKDYPVTLREQGHDIIRTWLFYSALRCLLLTGKQPFHNVLINGHILGPDGSKMSKSKGNVVSPEERLSEFGADAMRQALLSLKIGSDFPFKWEVVRYCKSFLQKYWSSSRFADLFLQGYDPACAEITGLNTLDYWILSRLAETITTVTEAMDGYEFHIALDSLQDFLWHDFCDNYLEAVKHRLYTPESPDEAESAKYTLSTVLSNATLMLAPFCPHITDEIYHRLYDSSLPSIHALAWPKAEAIRTDEKRKEDGRLLVEALSIIRKEKSKAGIPLNAPLQRVTLQGPSQTLAAVRNEEGEVRSILKVDSIVYEDADVLAAKIG
jgi:valyl-tRNA synthetase